MPLSWAHGERMCLSNVTNSFQHSETSLEDKNCIIHGLLIRKLLRVLLKLQFWSFIDLTSSRYSHVHLKKKSFLGTPRCCCCCCCHTFPGSAKQILWEASVCDGWQSRRWVRRWRPGYPPYHQAAALWPDDKFLWFWLILLLNKSSLLMVSLLLSDGETANWWQRGPC